VVFTDDLVPIDVTETKGHSSVMADVPCGRQGAVGEAINDYALIE
jgi:hypothetical protein